MYRFRAACGISMLGPKIKCLLCNWRCLVWSTCPVLAHWYTHVLPLHGYKTSSYYISHSYSSPSDITIRCVGIYTVPACGLNKLASKGTPNMAMQYMHPFRVFESRLHAHCTCTSYSCMQSLMHVHYIYTVLEQ